MGFANSLNNRGQVIGGSSIATNPGACFFLRFLSDCHPFLWDQGKLIDLNTSTSGGRPLSADWFNDAGQIVGAADFSATGGSPFEAYIWRNGVAWISGIWTAIATAGPGGLICGARSWGIHFYASPLNHCERSPRFITLFFGKTAIL